MSAKFVNKFGETSPKNNKLFRGGRGSINLIMVNKTVTTKQIQKFDKLVIEKYGVPSIVLMENAGASVAEEVIKRLRGRRRVCIVCGAGNNGGDGFVAARHLFNKGCQVTVVLIGKPTSLKHDAAVNFAVLKKLKIQIICVGAHGRAPLREIQNADIVVDAIFGVGLNRDIEEPTKSVIEAINVHAKKVLAVDTPSGLEATSGRIYGVCVKAHTTVTFTFAKKGFKTGVGPTYCGRIIVADIGIPKSLHKYCR